MNRNLHRCIFVFVATLLLGTPTAGLAADVEPDTNGDPMLRPAERVGPRHTIGATASVATVPPGTVGVTSGVWWVDEFGFVNIVGEVVNRTSERRQFVEVFAIFENASREVLGTASSFVFVNRLASGMTSPFQIVDEAPDGLEFVYVDVDPGTADLSRPGGSLHIDLGVPSTDGLGFIHYPGTITNLSSFPVEFTAIYMTLYDALGGVVDVGLDFASVDVLAPGAGSPFEVLFPWDDAGFVRAGVVADALEEGAGTRYATSWNNYFDDIGFSQFRADILWNADKGITTGCGAGLFCPDTVVARDQMASFLARALDLSGSGPDQFTDDEGNIHEPNINLVAREGITTGCRPNLYCPTEVVARDQMASFLARALDLSGSGPDKFTDDEENIHEPNINLVAHEGITTGCGVTNYCPSGLVSRGQMAAFLHRAFGP